MKAQLHQLNGTKVNHHHMSTNTCGGPDNERHTCIVPQDDDIEKSFRVNQDGSMTVEMKVHLTVKEEEMLHWTTTLIRSSLSKRTVCASVSELGKSSPNSNNAIAKDSSSINEDEIKEKNYPAGVGKGVTFNSELVHDGYTSTALGKEKTSVKRAPTPAPQYVRKTASVESMKMVTESRVQENTMGHYSYMKRMADGESSEGSCILRHNSSNNQSITAPQQTVSTGASSKGFHCPIRSSGVAEVLQIQSNGVEVTETVMHIYANQGCYNNNSANEEYSTDGVPLHGSTPVPDSKPSTESGQCSSSSNCDIDFSCWSTIANSQQRQKEDMLSLSLEPKTATLTFTNNLSLVTENEAQTATNPQSEETVKKIKTPKCRKSKKMIKPSKNHRSSTSTNSSDKKQKESIISLSKNNKHSSTHKLSSNASMGKRSWSSSGSAKNGQKRKGSNKEKDKPESKKSIKDKMIPRKDSSLLVNTKHLKGSPLKRQNITEAAARDNGQNVNIPTGRPRVKKKMPDILEPKKSRLPGKKKVSNPKIITENKISSSKKSLELGESVLVPSLNPTPSEIRTYVENWLENVPKVVTENDVEGNIFEERDEGEEVENIVQEQEEEEKVQEEEEAEAVTENDVEEEVQEVTEDIEKEVQNITDAMGEKEKVDEVTVRNDEKEAEVVIENNLEEEVQEVNEETEEIKGAQNIPDELKEKEEVDVVTEGDDEEEEEPDEVNEETDEEKEVENLVEEADEEEEGEEEQKEEEEEMNVVIEERDEEEDKTGVISEENNKEEGEKQEQEEEHYEEDRYEIDNTEKRMIPDEEEEAVDTDKNVGEEQKCDEVEQSRKELEKIEKCLEEESVEEREAAEEIEIEENMKAGQMEDVEWREDDKENVMNEGLDQVEKQESQNEAEEKNTAKDVDSYTDAKDCTIHNAKSPTKSLSNGQCEDAKGNGIETVDEPEKDGRGEHHEETICSLPHPVEISQELLDFINYALQSSSLIFTSDAQGNFRIEPDYAVVQTKKIAIPKSRKDSPYGLSCLPSPSTSDLSDYRPETSDSGGHKTQESVDIVTESGEEASERPFPVYRYKTDIPSGKTNMERTKSKLSASNSEVLQRLKSAENFSAHDSQTKTLKEDLSYFSAASSLNADAEAAPEATQCISFSSEKDSTEGVLIEQGRWLLKENHLIRKSPPVCLGMYGNLDSTSIDTGQENSNEDSPHHYKTPHNPLAVISSSGLEEMAKPQTPKCTYYYMPHGSDSDPFLDDSSVKSSKKDSSVKGRGFRVSPTIATSEAWANKNGSLSSFTSVEFKIPDRKVHPEGEPSVVTQARRASSGGGRVLQPQESQDTLHVGCGQYCPIL
uniref:Uncharacterized protein n=2 Tax=Monopterus albus TaxID=43700 RepID=A0A3Q3K730_MONAL